MPLYLKESGMQRGMRRCLQKAYPVATHAHVPYVGLVRRHELGSHFVSLTKIASLDMANIEICEPLIACLQWAFWRVMAS